MNVRALVFVAACSGALIVGCDKGDRGDSSAVASASAATAATTAPAASSAPMMGGEMGHHEDHAMMGGDGGAGPGMMRGPGGDHGPGDHRPH